MLRILNEQAQERMKKHPHLHALLQHHRLDIWQAAQQMSLHEHDKEIIPLRMSRRTQESLDIVSVLYTLMYEALLDPRILDRAEAVVVAVKKSDAKNGLRVLLREWTGDAMDDPFRCRRESTGG